jgi:hypothetical protein
MSMFLTSSQVDKNIDWLLYNGSAPIKYLTYRDLLGTSTSTKAMRGLWSEVESSPCVREIFAKQQSNGAWHSGGSWARSPSYSVKGGIDPYRPKYVTTVWILPLLAEMGYTARDKRILKACRYTIANGYFLDPIFSKPTDEISQTETNLCICRFSQYMMALGSVGFVDDEKVEKGYEVLLSRQGNDGGWSNAQHAEQMGWTRSCPWSSYHGTMALYCSNNPAHREALTRGAEFLLWHLSTKKPTDLQQFFYHGHSLVRELVMFSDLGLGLRSKAVRTILKWLQTMYDAEQGCFKYAGKPISRYTNKQDGIDSTVAKYRFYHLIETDWLTYHATRIAANMAKNKTPKAPRRKPK